MQPISSPARADNVGLLFVRSVALNMRERDADEVLNTSFFGTRQQWAMQIEAFFRNAPGNRVLRGTEVDGRPAAVFGAVEIWPGVWSAWMVATDEWPRAALSTTRDIIRNALPAVWENGAHRIEARSVAGYDAAHKWLKALGADHETTLKGYGRDGRDYEVFVWRPQDV